MQGITSRWAFMLKSGTQEDRLKAIEELKIACQKGQGFIPKVAIILQLGERSVTRLLMSAGLTRYAAAIRAGVRPQAAGIEKVVQQ